MIDPTYFDKESFIERPHINETHYLDIDPIVGLGLSIFKVEPNYVAYPDERHRDDTGGNDSPDSELDY